MTSLVVFESMYGNTRMVAEAIAEGMGGAEVVAVHAAPDCPADLELLVVGGPTHVHGMSTTRSRQMAVEAIQEDGDGRLEPGAAREPGLRAWIREMAPGSGARAAAFDTRADKSAWLTGAASRGIAKRLRRRGYDVIDVQSFLVEDSEGPLTEGELDRARAWGSQLARSVAAPAGRGAS